MIVVSRYFGSSSWPCAGKCFSGGSRSPSPEECATGPGWRSRKPDKTGRARLGSSSLRCSPAFGRAREGTTAAVSGLYSATPKSRMNRICLIVIRWGIPMAGLTQDKKRQLLQNHFLLGKLSSSEIETLVNYAIGERYLAGDEIFAKGSPGQSMYAVARGTVKISAPSLAGKEIVLNIIGPGEIFGEIALLDGLDRSGDAVAMTDCELLVMHRRDVIPVIEQRADICMM